MDGDHGAEHEHRSNKGDNKRHQFSLQVRSHKGAGHLVALIHIGQGVIAAKAVAVHNSLHQTADIEEADLILEEELDCLLVGTVGGAGPRPPFLMAFLQAARQRKVSSSATSKVSSFRVVKSSSGTTPGTRAG